MHRRQFIGTTLAASVALFGCRQAATEENAAASQGTAPAPLPERRRVKVAFMLGDGANVIDTAGPWEVFQDVMLPGIGHNHPFELYTVAPTAELLQMTGGLTVKPAYSIANAPQPNVIVVPAHKSTAESREWLKRASAGTDVTMSVCTGAFQLARAGLLEGIPATTHHEFFDSFAEEFPDIELGGGCASWTTGASRPPAGSPPASTWRCTSSRVTSASRPPPAQPSTWSTPATPGAPRRGDRRGRSPSSYCRDDDLRMTLRMKVSVPSGQMTAVASISTFARDSRSPATTTTDIAG